MTDKELEKLKKLIPSRNEALYKDWTEAEKSIDEIISCINMINSCILYHDMDKFNKKYRLDFDKTLGSRVVNKLIDVQKNEFEQATIHRCVHVDSDGISYSAIKWKDE